MARTHAAERGEDPVPAPGRWMLRAGISPPCTPGCPPAHGHGAIAPILHPFRTDKRATGHLQHLYFTEAEFKMVSNSHSLASSWVLKEIETFSFTILKELNW